MAYHIDGDFTDFGTAILLAELPDLLLFFGNLLLEHALQVRVLCAQVPEQYGGSGKCFLEQHRAFVRK